MKLIVRALLIITMLPPCFTTSYALNLKASQLSLTKPTIINETSTIFLDTTITIDNQVTLIKAGPQFNKSKATITFTTMKQHKIIIQNGGILDFSSFTNPYQQLLFKGAAACIIQAGGEIYFIDHRLSMNQNKEFSVLNYN
jgi:hypothetical protein